MFSRSITARRRNAQAGAAALLAVSGVLVLAGCQGDKPAPTVTPTATAVAPVTSVRALPPEPAAQAVWPLTGVASAKIVKRPTLSVKIENSSDARPQTGLEDADMVWEEVVEGGITRYIAMFNSTLPKEMGPVRSVRPMDANIIAPFGGMLAYSGGQRPFIDRVINAGIQSVVPTVAGGGFYRIGTRPAPHNMYASPKDVLARSAKGHKAAPGTQFDYADSVAGATAATQGKAAKTLAVTLTPIGHPTWHWDAKSSTFLRSEGATPAVSAAGKRFSATNVVVLRVPLETTRYHDPIGTPVPETMVIGSGKALVATGGKAVEAKWSKKSTKSQFVLTVGGKKVELAPGKTWFELMPTTGSWSLG